MRNIPRSGEGSSELLEPVALVRMTGVSDGYGKPFLARTLTRISGAPSRMGALKRSRPSRATTAGHPILPQ